MDKLIKAWQWIWRNKERIVLGVLVIVLFVQVTRVVRSSEEKLNVQTAVMPTGGKPEIPEPKAPEPSDPEKDYTALHVRNPFWVYSSTGEAKNDKGKSAKDLNIKLLDIQREPAGGFTAHIQTQGAKWYKEGEAFESFKLLRIDPQGRKVEVYSEELGQSITLSVQNK